MIQATVLMACGMFGTQWLYSPPVILAGGITSITVAGLLLMFWRGRVTGKQLT
jgi:hypothetical protein